jgi:hypothetical protein
MQSRYTDLSLYWYENWKNADFRQDYMPDLLHKYLFGISDRYKDKSSAPLSTASIPAPTRDTWSRNSPASNSMILSHMLTHRRIKEGK